MNRMYPGMPGGYKPNPWTGFSWGSKHTTYVQNNFFGGGGNRGGWGGVFHYGGFGGFRGGCGCNHGGGSWMNWMMGIGVGTTFLGGILNAFGIGGGGSTQSYSRVIDDNESSRRTTDTTETRRSARSSRSSSSTYNNLQEQINQLTEKVNQLTEELNRDNRRRVGDSDDDADVDVDSDTDVDNDTDVDDDNDVRGGSRTGQVDTDSDSDADDDAVAGARAVTIQSEVQANDFPVNKGDTWYHIAQGMYTGPNGAKLSSDEIKAIYTALRAQYVDGGHVENGQVLDKDNKPVDVSNMDLPKGNLKLPDTITANGKTYNYNSKGSVQKVNYSLGTVTKAGNYNARKTSDSKWIPTINGQDYGTTKYDSEQDAIDAAQAEIQNQQASNENVPIG